MAIRKKNPSKKPRACPWLGSCMNQKAYSYPLLSTILDTNLEAGQYPNRCGKQRRSFQSVPVQAESARIYQSCMQVQPGITTRIARTSSQKMSGVSRISVCKFTSHLVDLQIGDSLCNCINWNLISKGQTTSFVPVPTLTLKVLPFVLKARVPHKRCSDEPGLDGSNQSALL